ncbi:hypothetical protein OG21DRAFT_1514226 [Imleria badia]|nr:hypothetical protein OG21DRAFT_1514226 [Imleria badia]
MVSLSGKDGTVKGTMNGKLGDDWPEACPTSRNGASKATKDKGERVKFFKGAFVVELKLRIPPGWCDGKTAPNAHKLAELGS